MIIYAASLQPRVFPIDCWGCVQKEKPKLSLGNIPSCNDSWLLMFCGLRCGFGCVSWWRRRAVEGVPGG